MEGKTEEVVQEQPEVKQEKQPGALKNLFSYDWITKNIPFFFFLALLAVLYIANGHMADKTIRDINRTARQLKELQYEYKTLKSEVMFKSREAELIKAAQPLGLQLSDQPPMRITLEKRDNKQ
ncbi:FtsL-like putative cell division protein [Danxiaibacter flavus]|uniref:FtsL-like putative cell division protein n=1 Tax=Danxiaibacter flavus TaxID=3049108 RepID=A0ABV3Z7R8_9BACT|nr:FtsL-like putative cell division protein [Chitinophagaceae bacterium DXS]